MDNGTVVKTNISTKPNEISQSQIKNKSKISSLDDLVVSNVSKIYGNVQALDGVTLYVKKGQTIALLGENGAGKTTLIETIIGLRTPETGSIHILGNDIIEKPRAVQHKLGVQLQEMNLLPKITVYEYLKLFSGFYQKVCDIESLIARLGLGPYLGKKISSLSGGWKQKVSIALALINEPELLILDEPTTGFDPIARKSIWTLIEEMKIQNRTILLSTHHMEEAEKLADVIAIISKGKIIATGTAKELKARINRENVSLDDVFSALV